MMRMQLGAVVDYCVEYDNQERRAEKPERKKATQADIDAYFGGRKKG